MPLPDDLPPPSTSRTLQPRATSLAHSDSATWTHLSASRSGSRGSSSSNSRRSSVVLPTASIASFESEAVPPTVFPDSQPDPSVSLADGVEDVDDGPQPGRSGVKRKRSSSDASLPPPTQTQSSCESDYTEVQRLLDEPDGDIVGPSSSQVDYKGKGKAKAPPPPSPTTSVLILDDQDSPDRKRVNTGDAFPDIDAQAALADQTPKPPSKSPEPELLANYTCPICFCPPTNATLTPCGHICCGPCLFTAVKSTISRSQLMMAPDGNIARCPVCRAEIRGWDGKGGGVIGLKVRAIFSL